jgi:hypothetical protein
MAISSAAKATMNVITAKVIEVRNVNISRSRLLIAIRVARTHPKWMPEIGAMPRPAS